MGTLFALACWIVAAGCAAVIASWAVRVSSGGRWRDRRAWFTPLPFALAAVIALTVLGITGILAGALLAAGLACVMAAVLWRADEPPHHVLRWHAATGLGFLGRDARLLYARMRAMAARDESGPVADVPGHDPAADPAVRAVPRLREDEALGPAPEPAEAAAAAGVIPAPWAELAGWIADFHPENDNEQSAFIHGHAAGLAAVAHALSAHAETMTNDIGLDPSYGLAVLELGSGIGEHASDAALVDRRYHLIYGDVKNSVDGGLILPYNSRQWFGDPGAGSAA